MGPDGVDDNSEQRQAREEEQPLGQGHVGVELRPVGPGYPTHVVGEHHAAVEHVDHHPLVSFPEQGPCPASLGQARTDEEKNKRWKEAGCGEEREREKDE